MRVIPLPIRVGLKGLLSVMTYLVFPLLGVRIGLKGLAMVMTLPSSILVPISLYVTHSLTYAQGL
jgi:hypothetical protein